MKTYQPKNNIPSATCPVLSDITRWLNHLIPPEIIKKLFQIHERQKSGFLE